MDYMKRNNILPKQTFEEEKIKNQLNKKQSLRSQNQDDNECGDEYFNTMKDQTIKEIQRISGKSYDKIKHWLDSNGGYPENNP